MENITEVRVPNIGDFEDVIIIEILVSAGSVIKKEDPLIILESDKASMDIPAPCDGIVKEVFVKVGDEVSENTIILSLEQAAGQVSEAPAVETAAAVRSPETMAADSEPQAATETPKDADQHGEVVVLGGGPGGYTAAFRAADLGKKVILIERFPVIGGVCLNVGCIPSKVLLHVAKIIEEALEASKFGVGFEAPKLQLDKMQEWKDSVVSQLSGGLLGMAKQRKISIVNGHGKFISESAIEVAGEDSTQVISFDSAIIAAGSEPIMIPGIPRDERIITSTGALSLKEIPGRMLIIGGGIVGLEMATVYHALGSEITVVEAKEQLIPGADSDLIRPLFTFVKKKFKDILLETKVSSVSVEDSGVKVVFEGNKAPDPQEFDIVLVSVGRRPRSGELSLEKAGVETDAFGHIIVDNQQRTRNDRIFAVGDIVGAPMLAHKASYEGKIAAEVICGLKSYFDAVVIPSIAYTDPEIAWAGVTEREASEKHLEIEKAVFPWSASGRSLTMGRKEGKTKMIFDKASSRVIGAGIVGSNASELISEMALSIEMGCTAEDLSMTIHPHPTLSESITFAAEIFEGSITDLYLPKKKTKTTP
ncbi:MAG: dihydrolipoyl dehydrogenase [Deltaproteobacteria bacterium]|nr:dihydrolipoyl dehydrogenase [Deltaproteobacteria bacterium]